MYCVECQQNSSRKCELKFTFNSKGYIPIHPYQVYFLLLTITLVSLHEFLYVFATVVNNNEKYMNILFVCLHMDHEIFPPTLHYLFKFVFALLGLVATGKLYSFTYFVKINETIIYIQCKSVLIM